MKFCISWADDNPTVTPRNTAEFLDIVKTWIDKYFLRGEYYTISNSPVVIVLNSGGLRNALGGSVKPAFDAARQMARAAGLNGIYFIGGAVSLASQVTQMAAEGYDATTAYDYSSYSPSVQNRSPYSAMVDADATIWDTVIASKTIPS